MAAFSSIAAGVGAATALANTGMGIAGAAGGGGPGQFAPIPEPEAASPFAPQGAAPSFQRPIGDDDDDMGNPFGGGIPGGGGWL